VFDALAARGSAVAPGMREVARRETTGPAGEIVIARAEGHDTCVRVAFSATQAVTARLVDGAGNVLAETDAPATEGVLADKGPVCVRKGDVITGVGIAVGTDGTAAAAHAAQAPYVAYVTYVRWVAWQAP
jgi:hypothetical protein